ncbi:MAG: type II secretion system protein GspM [Pseudomonadota bacterium]
MSPLLSRLAAITLALAFAGLLIFGVALPLSAHFAARQAEIAALDRQIALFRAELANAAPETRLEVADPALIPEATEAMAGANLQDRMGTAIRAAGGELISIRTRDTEPFDRGLKVPVSAQLTIDMAGMQRLLHALETETPYLFVSRLDARQSARERRRTGEAEATRTVTLDLSVFGVVESPEEAAGGSDEPSQNR